MHCNRSIRRSARLHETSILPDEAARARVRCSIRRSCRRAIARLVPKLDPRTDDEEPGDVRGGSRRRDDHRPADPRPGHAAPRRRASTFQITLWLWFTVLFANFAEAMAEGRGKAQADTLRKTKTETIARRLHERHATETVAATQLRRGDIVVCEAGRRHPGRRRRDRGHRQRGRDRDHRRERAGDPRIRRRPQRGHRRHEGALATGSWSGSRPIPARRSSTG